MGKVITVTREFGSMGRKIAMATAEKLGFRYYDRDIIEMTVKELHGNLQELSAMEEKGTPLFSRMVYPLGIGSSSMQNQLYEMEKSVIIDLAAADDCVIVGRCSDYILRECKHPNMLNVFIYAPYDKRVAFSENELNLSYDQAKAYIAKVDKARHDFYKMHTGVSFHSTKYRHMMLDSSITSHGNCAEIICAAAREKFGL